MQRAAFIVFLPTLIARICLAGLIIETSKLDESRLVEVSIDILESCYGDRFSTVGFAGPSAGSIITRMSLRDTPIATTLIDDDSRVESQGPVGRGSRYKLPVFVITTTDRSALNTTLHRLRDSKWWNHMASVLLIGWPEVKQGCSNAYELLWTAWEKNLLNSKFLCLHPTSGHLIYTFNPYISKAPVPWQQKHTYKKLDGHIWTLFAREHRDADSTCVGLDFDKTVDLGGYEIRATVKGMEYWWFADPEKEPILLDRVQNVTAQILKDSLNATWNLFLEPKNGSAIVGHEKYDWIEAISFGYSDICLNFLLQHTVSGFQITYPAFVDDLAILTRYPDNKSQLDKIISVLDRSSRFGVFVVFMITLLFFKFWLGKPIIAAILDLVLILCNAALLRIPERLASRIYLATLFMFVVTLQGIYQGQFASLLTKEVRLPTIDTIADLARSNHKIYAEGVYKMLFNESAFKGRSFNLSLDRCARDILLDPKVACVGATSRLIGLAANHKLHLSRETIDVVYGTYIIRDDWPLEERVNKILGSAAAAGIMDRLYKIQRGREMNTIRNYENREQESGPKVLTMTHLAFAFVILGIGLGCATIVFILEVAFFESLTQNPPNRIRRPVNRRHR